MTVRIVRDPFVDAEVRVRDPGGRQHVHGLLEPQVLGHRPELIVLRRNFSLEHSVSGRWCGRPITRGWLPIYFSIARATSRQVSISASTSSGKRPPKVSSSEWQSASVPANPVPVPRCSCRVSDPWRAREPRLAPVPARPAPLAVRPSAVKAAAGTRWRAGTGGRFGGWSSRGPGEPLRPRPASCRGTRRGRHGAGSCRWTSWESSRNAPARFRPAATRVRRVTLRTDRLDDVGPVLLPTPLDFADDDQPLPPIPDRRQTRPPTRPAAGRLDRSTVSSMSCG